MTYTLKHDNIPNMLLHLSQIWCLGKHTITQLPRNDWFLNWEVIDPYPECKWKCPQHHSSQPALVLLGRWEATCGKMKAICLDGAMSSERRLWCKQLYLSGCDKPWTVKAYARPAETPFLESRQPLTDMCRDIIFKTQLRPSFMHWSPSRDDGSRSR